MHNINSLFTSLKDLPGVGDKKYALLQNLGCSSLLDLILHLPSRFILKQFEPKALSIMEDGKHVIVSVLVKGTAFKERSRWNKLRTKIKCRAMMSGEDLELVFFNYFPEYIFKNLKDEAKLIVAGELTKSKAGSLQLVHPKIYRNLSEIRKIDPIYPLVAGLSSAYINKLALLCIDSLERQRLEVQEWLSPDIISANSWMSLFESIKALHNLQDLDQQEKLRERIAFDEMLANHIAIRIFRDRYKEGAGEALQFSMELANKVLASTNMILTAGQAEALRDIQCDQKDSKRMIRLLQGDVGSGKTLVALLASLNTIEAGKQVALMVPTDILSNQHFNLISKLLKPFDIKVELLTGSTAKSQRNVIKDKLKAGEIQFLIGTHALFQHGVEFKSLGLSIIDEQHRFGVQQRLALINKNKACDVLAMSATPIPRTLAMIMYGDMDISIIKDKPACRVPIKTITTRDSNLGAVVEFIKTKLQNKEKVFWVCPSIETKSEEDLDAPFKENNNSSATARFDALKKVFGEKVGLVHGKLKNSDKEKVMNEFIHGSVDILVATTVIEVGIDVPEATLLVIEQASSFGLSQLHQLRGRVGRGNKPSDCILMFPRNIGPEGCARLNTIRDSNDGFHIAEQDLKLRGGGEILGYKQSGLPEFRTFALEEYYYLMASVADYANKIIKHGRVEKFYPLLRIFGYDVEMRVVHA